MLNVRLTEDDQRLVRKLRGQGVKISEVVRAAIRAEARLRSVGEHDPVEAVEAAIAAHPTPPGAPRRTTPRLDDSKAMRRFIVAQLKARR